MNQPNVHEYDTDRKQANLDRELARIALTALGFSNIQDTPKSQDIIGVDFTCDRAVRNQPRSFKVEHKARQGGVYVPRYLQNAAPDKDGLLPWAEDLVLETWSDIKAGYPGWTLDGQKISDLVIWTWQGKPGEDAGFIMLPYKPLREALQANLKTWRAKYRVEQQTSRKQRNGRLYEYQSETIKVPIRVLLVAIKDAASFNADLYTLCGWAGKQAALGI